MSRTNRNFKNIDSAGFRKFPKNNSLLSFTKKDFTFDLEDNNIPQSVVKKLNRQFKALPNTYDDIFISSLREGKYFQ